MEAALDTATWWSYAETDGEIVLAIVVLVVLAALAFVGWRVAGARTARRRR